MPESSSFEIDAERFRHVLKRTFRTLTESSLRASIIMTSSRVESMVGDICEKHLPVVSSASHIVRANGLLKMRIIDESIRDLIKHLADIRNEFAHRDEDFDLSDPAVAPHLSNFLGKARKGYGGEECVLRIGEIATVLLAKEAPVFEKAWLLGDERQLVIYAAYLQIQLAAIYTFEQPKPRTFGVARVKFNLEQRK